MKGLTAVWDCIPQYYSEESHVYFLYWDPSLAAYIFVAIIVIQLKNTQKAP